MTIYEQDNQAEEPGALDRTRRDTFLLSLIAKRKEAIAGRIASGIETEWQEDEEHYQGIDDANRAYAASSTSHAKRWATTGRDGSSTQPGRSVVFLNITRPYVDAASSRVSDMLLPTDDRCWLMKQTPIPRLSAMQIESFGGEEAIEAAVEQAKQSAKLMQDEIDDCLKESNFHGEMRHMIEDCARIGSGVVKGPFPIKRTAKVFRDMGGVKEFVTLSEIKPGSKRIDPWNFFPDPACGESIHNGSYTWEREYLSSRQIREMIDMPGYDAQEIIYALKEGPKVSQSRQASDGSQQKAEEQFELWIFYGQCDADDLQAVGVETEDESPKASAMAVMLNDRLVKVTLNVMDSGDFPYDVLAWQRRPSMPWGMGVSRQVRTPQRMLNGACRAMMDNSGLASSPQIVIGNGITPADGNYNLRGGKTWMAEADVVDVRQAFFAFVPPSVQAELMNIIQFAQKIAEDVTGLPAMLQGIRGDAPDTLGGMQMQNNNATSVLRRLAKRFDDYITCPHIQRYYDWMMQHSERDDIKGDFQIEVRASSALVERDAQQQFLMTLLQVALNPAYELDPAKLATELLKGQRLEPKSIQYSPDKLAQMQNQSNPVDQAKAELIAAQTRKTDAEAVNKSVEGMHFATQAGSQIAMSPAVAPLADKLLRSAGFQDKDAAPIVPEIAAPMEGIAPPEHNTNPLYPANPNVGMNRGIEGGNEARD